MKRIIVRSDTKGGVTVKTEGFSGVECQNITADLLAGLGAVVTDEATPEMYETAADNLITESI
jgi:hypothetical protein